MNKELLEPIMRAHGDKNKDLAAALVCPFRTSPPSGVVVANSL